MRNLQKTCRFIPADQNVYREIIQQHFHRAACVKMDSLLTFDLLLVLVIVGLLIMTVSCVLLERPPAPGRYYRRQRRQEPSEEAAHFNGLEQEPIEL